MLALVIPMTDYSANNKTVSNEIRKENNRTYQNNVIVVSFSLFVRETTQCILPYPPEFLHSNNLCFDVPALSFDIFPIPVSSVSHKS